MVHGLANHWISGLTTASVTDLFSSWLQNCATNTFYNRDKSMIRNHEIRMPGACKQERELIQGLAAHYYGSPIWDLVRTENKATYDKYKDVWTPSNLVQMLFAQFTFLSDNIVVAARYFLEHADARQSFRADPEKAVLEINSTYKSSKQ